MHMIRPAGPKPALLALGLLAAAAVWMPTSASAQVSATIVPTIVPGSPNSYSYTLINTGTETIGEFDLSVPTTAALTNVGAPTGWLALYTTGDTFIQWLSTDPSTDIGTGNSLGGFSFKSALAPGLDSDLVRSLDTGDSATGMTLGPSTNPVPEGSTTVSLGLLLALGLGGMLVAAKRRKA